MDTPSALSLIPPIVVMAMAVWLKRPILALVLGAAIGLALLSGREHLVMAEQSSVYDFVTSGIAQFADIALSVMKDDTIGWLILVCGGFGALIGLLIHTGGALAFGRDAAKLATGQRSSLLMTVFLGIVIFVDDYLNALSVGEAMKRVTDKYKISRQMLAYIVDSTAAPICVIIPISTWAIFFGGLLENNNVAEQGHGIEVYMHAIPYMLYPWLALLMVLLVAGKVVPAFGPMRKAEDMAQQGLCYETGRNLQEVLDTSDTYAVHATEQSFAESKKDGKLMNFLVPMAMLIAFTIYFDIDVWKGLICTLILTIPFYAVQKLMSISEMMEVMMNGFKTMLPAICTVIAAFIFKDVCDKLMLPQFVIENLTPYMTAKLLPAVVFLAMAILAFATGSSWGIFAVSIPIVMPLAVAVDANIPMVIGALLSASSFGSQACFYSDSTVLAAQGSGCSLISHAITQLPYCLIAAGIAFVGFIVIA